MSKQSLRFCGRELCNLREMFRPADAHVPDVERFAMVQIVTLAHDIGIAFGKEDPAFDDILVETVRGEINRPR